MKATDLSPGDVVQIDAEITDNFFAGCFMQVTEVRSWGAIGFVCMPRERGQQPGQAFTRVPFEIMERIGTAVWVARTDLNDDKPEEGGNPNDDVDTDAT